MRSSWRIEPKMFQGASTWHWFKTRHDSDRGTKRPYPKWAYILRHDRAEPRKDGYAEAELASIRRFRIASSRHGKCTLIKYRQNNKGRKKKGGSDGGGTSNGARRWGDSLKVQYSVLYCNIITKRWDEFYMYKQANYCATIPCIMPLDSEYSRYHTHAHTSSSGIDRSADIHEKHLQVTTVELPADLFT